MKLFEKNSLLNNSKYTLSANLINQLVGVIIFLVIPNILNKNEYAQTVYISVLVSFMVLSTFGMNFLYNRLMPSIYAVNDTNKIEEYNQTFFLFIFFMSICGSIIIATIYYLKYNILLNSILLLIVNPLLTIVTFSIQKHTVNEDFKIYRNINFKNSLFKILTMPFFTYIFSLTGWIFSQSLISLLTLRTIKNKSLFNYHLFNYSIIKNHFFEAIILLMNFFLWSQLLNSGRFYSTINFSDEVIAQYGITNAGYSLLLTLMISIFLPVTIASLKIMKDDVKGAIDKLFNVIIKTSLIIFLVVIISIEIAPYLYTIFFPSYVINFKILEYQLLSLMTLPFYATLGNIFIGTKQPLKLLSIYLTSGILSFIVFKLIIVEYGVISAAISQFIAITFMGSTLFLTIFLFFSDYIENKKMKFLKLFSFVFVPYILYYIIRSLL